ncbi:MAG: family acetyltransferase [Rhodospirillales bacterium]|jgi:ribosomal protein S18 acetylase RimI-like enzyme|nr:family acetyltransferase [Rhodospirillales bacterium]
MAESSEASPGGMIRVMSRRDLDLAVAWAEAEGWNPGRDDATVFHATDPLGFFGCYVDDRLVASLSLVAYGPHYAFLGLYIVRPGERGRGYGMRLWREAMSRRPAACIGLDGVLAQQDNYRKSGFRLAYRNIRYGGVVTAAPSPGLMPLDALPFDAILDYDRQFFPAPRPGFLSLWIRPATGAGLAAVVDGRIAGFGVVRACREGFKIGPLYGDDEGIAEALFRSLAATAGGEKIFLDVPEPNPAARRLAERHGLTPVFETARMYAGALPGVPLDCLFGVSTFELG